MPISLHVNSECFSNPYSVLVWFIYVLVQPDHSTSNTHTHPHPHPILLLTPLNSEPPIHTHSRTTTNRTTANYVCAVAVQHGPSQLHGNHVRFRVRVRVRWPIFDSVINNSTAATIDVVVVVVVRLNRGHVEHDQQQRTVVDGSTRTTAIVVAAGECGAVCDSCSLFRAPARTLCLSLSHTRTFTHIRSHKLCRSLCRAIA